MAQNGRPTVFRIKEFVHEDMHRGAEGVEGKVPDVLREREQCERSAKGQVCECGLP